MKSQEIRSKFLSFFEKRNHVVLPSASLVTQDEAGTTNATLFNTAGMQPLVPYLMGQKHPAGTRLASSQKCVRTVDIEEVGDNTHATFFEMLGNWSLGDYFKSESIAWSWEFLTDKNTGLGLDPKRIYVTVFAGGNIDGKDVDRDSESVKIWSDIFTTVGMDPEKRIFYKLQDNWWSAGDNSPCGATTEMFYDLSGNHTSGLKQDDFERIEEDQEIVEIWNNVFMEYEKENGVVIGDLVHKNVDTGAGLERLAAVLQNVSSLAETDLFIPLMDIIKLESENYVERDARIIADHIKTAVFMVSDGVKTSNTGRGYILRRMIRRGVNSMKNIGFETSNTQLLIDDVVAMYDGVYNFSSDQDLINGVINGEVQKYLKTLARGEKELAKISQKKDFVFTGEVLANLEQTHGLPFDTTVDIAQKMGIEIPESAIAGYHNLKKNHQEKSRTAGAGTFKGGLAGDSPKITALHTTTHLMLAGLRKYLGNDVHQKGSNITEDRTRFDFTYHEKVSRDILDQVEKFVNNAIQSGANVEMQKMQKTTAQQSDVTGSFWEKYPDEVDVYTIADTQGTVYSRELCGGPHVATMSDIAEFGIFKIKKEESSSAGVRRIKAVLIKD
ncbi:MAG: alanine--tRNA ligase [Minisyncoccia bacterium]